MKRRGTSTVSGDFHQALEELAGFEAEFGPDAAVAAVTANLRGVPEPPAANTDWDGVSRMMTK